MAKQFGYIGKNESLKDQRERFRRSHEMGKQLHLQHLQNMRNSRVEADNERRIARENEALSDLQEKESQETSIPEKPFEFLKSVETGTEEGGPEASEENPQQSNG